MSKRDVIRKLAGLGKGSINEDNRSMSKCIWVMSERCKEHEGYCDNCKHYELMPKCPIKEVS